MPYGVNVITNVTKVYPNMISVVIYKTPQVFPIIDRHSISHLKDVNKKSSYQSAWRAKTAISDIIKCNDFEWFVTFTFSPDKVNRYSFGSCYLKIMKWLHNQADKGTNFKYLVIPEQHKDGAWHYHALLSNCPANFVLSGVKTKTGRPVYNIKSYRSGFSTAVKIEDKEIVSRYVTKYVIKSLLNYHGQRRYYCSHNLIRPIREINSDKFRSTLPIFRKKVYEDSDKLCFVLPPF